MEVHTWICVLFLLTYQYKSIVVQSIEIYDKRDDELTEIPTDIPPGVEEVRIYSSQLITIKTNAFRNLSQCRHLFVGSNISEIEPGAFKGLTALISLYLPDNRLERLYVNTFSGVKNCKSLYLDYNQISEIEPGAFNGLISMTYLLLFSNSIERLSVNMFTGINNCRWISLTHNDISEIEPGSFDGLDNLERLDLEYNLLTVLSTDIFRELSKCMRIALNLNQISEIEVGSFNGLSALERISLWNNQLERLHTNMFSGLTNCTDLRLWSNQISVIEPGSFNGLSNVEQLYLSFNSLTTLRPGTFQGLLSARGLDLAINNINLIEDNAFIGLKSLEDLDLHSNKLETLTPGIFCFLDSLRKLNLKKNRLTSLPADVFNHLPRPLRVDVSDNPLECDAALCWLKQEELNGNITYLNYLGRPTCAKEVNWFTWFCNETGSIDTMQCKAMEITDSPETVTTTKVSTATAETQMTNDSPHSITVTITDSSETTKSTETSTTTGEAQGINDNLKWILISLADVLVVVSIVIIVICVKRRRFKLCQGSSQDGATQNTDISSNNFPVGFNNTALSMENDRGYQGLQMQRNDYERLRHPRQTGDASGSMDAEYVEVTDYSTSLPRPSVSVISTTVSMATEDESGYTLPNNPHGGYVDITDYNSV